MSKKRVAIIGSNGFIGRHLVKKIQSQTDVELQLYGKGDKSFFGNEFRYRHFEVNNADALRDAFQNFDLVYYLVSETIPSTSWEDPLIDIEKNLIPFTKFLNGVSRAGIQKIAFVSSAGTVYGATQGKVSEDSNKSPFSPYGIIKLTMENLLNHYRVKTGMQFDVFRVSNVYGEGQNTKKGLGIINTFLENIITHNSVKIYGDGKSTRNYIYVKDVAELLSLSLRKNDSAIYNVSSNSTLSINELVQEMKAVLEEDFKVNYIESRQSDNSYVDLDNTRILENCKGFVFTEIKEGILTTYRDLKSVHAGISHK